MTSRGSPVVRVLTGSWGRLDDTTIVVAESRLSDPFNGQTAAWSDLSDPKSLKVLAGPWVEFARAYLRAKFGPLTRTAREDSGG